MYTLYRVSFNRYVYRNEKTGFKSGEMPLDIMTETLVLIGVSPKEIIDAVDAMQQTGDNIAEFGFNRKFVFTRKMAA